MRSEEGGGYMAMDQSREEDLNISQEDVAHLARLYGLPLTEEDLPEITVRLNLLFDELGNLNRLDLSQKDPLPLFLNES
jgi:Asp-tRNA(Asn)/Glu-tRNA(Gln) amidotransferase C subunit